MDGAYTGEICNIKIYSTNVCFDFADYNYNPEDVPDITCGLVRVASANQNDRRAVVNEGDSGGPVETPIGSSAAEARGEIIGGQEAVDGAGYDAIGYYTPINTLTSSYSGVSVMLYRG